MPGTQAKNVGEAEVCLVRQGQLQSVRESDEEQEVEADKYIDEVSGCR